MNAVQAVMLTGGGLVLIAVAVTMMIRINRKERLVIERRRAAWIAAGSISEDRPNFYSGSGGESLGGS